MDSFIYVKLVVIYVKFGIKFEVLNILINVEENFIVILMIFYLEKEMLLFYFEIFKY